MSIEGGGDHVSIEGGGSDLSRLTKTPPAE